MGECLKDEIEYGNGVHVYMIIKNTVEHILITGDVVDVEIDLILINKSIWDFLKPETKIELISCALGHFG